MGYLVRILERRKSPENPSTSLSNPSEWLYEAFGATQTKAGNLVTNQNALNIVGVFSCIQIVAESIAALPLILYRRTGTGKERATDHALYDQLHRNPNPSSTSYSFFETVVAHVESWGNGFAWIRPDGLWPLLPDRMNVVQVNGRPWYRYYPDGFGDESKAITLRSDEVLHIAGLGFDGLTGYSRITMVRNAIGLAKATEAFGSEWFGNGSRVAGVLQHPGRLSDKTTSDRIKASWESAHSGDGNWHKAAVLEEGMTWQAIGIPPDDAQFLETRKFQLQEFARYWRIPPHMLGDLDKATFSNIEHQALEFVVHSLRPRLVRVEQELDRKLLTTDERNAGMFFEFLVDGLLRGDLKARYDAYAIGKQWGWLSTNDIRGFENMNPTEDGDVYLSPLNMVPSDQFGAAPVVDAGDPAADAAADARSRRAAELAAVLDSRNTTRSRRQLQARYVSVYQDAARRFVGRLVADLRRGIKRHLAERDAVSLEQWLPEFFEKARVPIARSMRPVVESFSGAILDAALAEISSGSKADIARFVSDYIDSFAKRYTTGHHAQLAELLREKLNDGDLVDALDERLGEWIERDPEKIARRETQRGMSAFARAAWVAVGVTHIRWITTSDSCPLCNGLAGRVVGIDQTFVAKGDRVGSDTETPLNAHTDYYHPPLHDGCDCTISAG